MVENISPQKLELGSTLAFAGKLKKGLAFHRDKRHIVYSAGQTLIAKDLVIGKEIRFCGHSSNITCLSISRDGTFLASGQESFSGVKKVNDNSALKADVIVWNFHKKNIYGSHSVHKGKVEAVAFTCDSKYVVSLGGIESSNVIVYDIDGLNLLCVNTSAPVAGGYASILTCVNTRNDVFISAGNSSLRVWKIDYKLKRVNPTNASIGRIKRDIKCLDTDYSDKFMYCGTATGDILKLQMIMEDGEKSVYDAKLLCCLTRLIKKEIVGDTPLYEGAVSSIAILKTGELLIGSGNGLVCRAAEYEHLQKSSAKKPTTKKTLTDLKLRESERTLIDGEVTSLAVKSDGLQFLVGSGKSEIYLVTLNGFHCERLYTCHRSIVNDVVFPHKCSDLFVTCSNETIRVWNLGSSQELLRIEIPKMTCNTIFLMKDGRSIISGWNDGKIRAHTPETGHCLYTIEKAHQPRVTAITATSDCSRIISGGGDGEVRVWNVSPTVQTLVRTMRDHRGKVTCICMKKNDRECVSSCGDGTCIIWDLVRFIRLQVIFANTLFQAVCYGINEEEIICSGTDRNVSYYEVIDGTPLRALEASTSGSINAIDITDDCKVFVTGGADKLIKVWKYLEGEATHIGEGHNDEIVALRISPDKRHIISVGKDGCIIRWKFPNELL